MKEHTNGIDWLEVWEISKQIILPNIGWFLFWGILFIVLGFIISIVLNVYLYKKNVFSREHKYHNLIAKIWIPYIIVVCLYFFGMLGLVYGGHSVLSNENKTITSNIYSKTIGTTFSTEKDKKAFLLVLQQFSNSSEDMSKSLTKALKLYLKKNNTGMAAVDDFKNSSSAYLFQKYEPEIYSATIYGFLKVVDHEAHIVSFRKINYSELKLLLKKLDKIEPKKIEQSIQLEIGNKLQKFLDYIYKELIKQELLFFVLFMMFPFIEYFIYLKYAKKKTVSVTDEQTPSNIDNQ